MRQPRDAMSCLSVPINYPADEMTSKQAKTSVITTKLSDRVSVYTSLFQDEVWFHLKDHKKDKSVSITKHDMSNLFSKRKELSESIRLIQKSGKRQAADKQHLTQGNKKNKELKKSKTKRKSDLRQDYNNYDRNADSADSEASLSGGGSDLSGEDEL